MKNIISMSFSSIKNIYIFILLISSSLRVVALVLYHVKRRNCIMGEHKKNNKIVYVFVNTKCVFICWWYTM